MRKPGGVVVISNSFITSGRSPMGLLASKDCGQPEQVVVFTDSLFTISSSSSELMVVKGCKVSVASVKVSFIPKMRKKPKRPTKECRKGKELHPI